MSSVNGKVLHPLKDMAGDNFIVRKYAADSILFENKLVSGDLYILECAYLSSDEILSVGKIILEAYESLGEFSHSGWTNGKKHQLINRRTEKSARYVQSIINLESSSLHKFLLLMSGDRLLLQYSLELVTELAKAKRPIVTLDQNSVDSASSFKNLKSLYIVPGFVARTLPPSSNWIDALAVDEGLMNAARLCAFLSDKNSKITLQEHFAKDFSEAIQTTKALNSLVALDIIQRLLTDDYRDFALSMNAKELLNFGSIMSNVFDGKFPKDLIMSRCSKLDHVAKPVASYQSESIGRFMNLEERKALSSEGVIEEANMLLRGRDFKARVHSIVFASVAELFVTVGEERTLEIVHAFEHLRSARTRNLAMYEATVGLISDALKPENREFPFAWMAQFSEHAWVLDSHKNTDERSLQTLVTA